MSRDTRPTGGGRRTPGAGHDPDETQLLFERRRRRNVFSRFRLVLIGLLIVVLASVGVWLVYFSPVLALDEVEVTGTSVLSTEDVLAAARAPEGTPLMRVDLELISRRVDALSAVREVEVTRSWPDKVTIAVTERVAIAVVVRDDTYRGLDADGVAFLEYEEPPEELPLVELGEDAGAEALQEAARVVAAMPERTATAVASISVLSVDEITLELRNGASVVWGSAEDSEEKADVLDVLLAQELEVDQYDVSVPGRPTTR